MTDADNLPPFDRVPLGPPPLPKVDDLPPLPTVPPPRASRPPADKPKPEPAPTPTPVAAKPAPAAATARDLLRPSRKLVAGAAAVASLAAGIGGIYLTGRTTPAPKEVSEAPTPATGFKPSGAGVEVLPQPKVELLPPAAPVELPTTFPTLSNDPPAVSARTTPAVPVLEPTNSRPGWADRTTVPGINPNDPPLRVAPLELPTSVTASATRLPDISLPGVTLPAPVVQAGGEAPAAVPAVPVILPPAIPTPSLPAPKVEAPPAPAEKPKDPTTIPPVVAVPAGPTEAKPVTLPPSPFTAADGKPLTEVKPAAVPVVPNPVTLPPAEGPKPPVPTQTTPVLPQPGFNTVPQAEPPTLPVTPKPTTPPSAAVPLPAAGDNPFRTPDAAPPTAVAPFPPVAAEPQRPALAAPLGAAFLKPAGAADVRTDFDVELHDPKPADTYETISKLHYGDTRYAAALRAFNRNQLIGGGRNVEVPPAAELKRRYGTASDRPVR